MSKQEELRNNAKKLINIFRERNMAKDDIIGLGCAIEKVNAYQEIIHWLEENEQADIEEISDKVLDIYEREEEKLSK